MRHFSCLTFCFGMLGSRRGPSETRRCLAAPARTWARCFRGRSRADWVWRSLFASAFLRELPSIQAAAEDVGPGSFWRHLASWSIKICVYSPSSRAGKREGGVYGWMRARIVFNVELNVPLDGLGWGSHGDASWRYLLGRHHGGGEQLLGAIRPECPGDERRNRWKYFHFPAFLEKGQGERVIGHGGIGASSVVQSLF